MWPQRMAVSHSHHMVETRILSSVFLPITRIQSQKADGFQPLCPLLWTDARFPGHRQTGYPLTEGSSQGCVLQEGCALRIRKRKPSMQGRAGSCGMRARSLPSLQGALRIREHKPSMQGWAGSCGMRAHSLPSLQGVLIDLGCAVSGQESEVRHPSGSGMWPGLISLQNLYPKKRRCGNRSNFSPTEFFDKERMKQGRKEEGKENERKAKLLKSFQEGAAW